MGIKCSIEMGRRLIGTHIRVYSIDLYQHDYLCSLARPLCVCARACVCMRACVRVYSVSYVCLTYGDISIVIINVYNWAKLGVVSYVVEI